MPRHRTPSSIKKILRQSFFNYSSPPRSYMQERWGNVFAPEIISEYDNEFNYILTSDEEKEEELEQVHSEGEQEEMKISPVAASAYSSPSSSSICPILYLDSHGISHFTLESPSPICSNNYPQQFNSSNAPPNASVIKKVFHNVTTQTPLPKKLKFTIRILSPVYSIIPRIRIITAPLPVPLAVFPTPPIHSQPMVSSPPSPLPSSLVSCRPLTCTSWSSSQTLVNIQLLLSTVLRVYIQFILQHQLPPSAVSV